MSVGLTLCRQRLHHNIQSFYFREETGTRYIATGTSMSIIQIWSSKPEDRNTNSPEITHAPDAVTPVCVSWFLKFLQLIRVPVVYPLSAFLQHSVSGPSIRIDNLPPNVTGLRNDSATLARPGGSFNPFAGRRRCRRASPSLVPVYLRP